jgi:predicted outer membrane repeat protein
MRQSLSILLGIVGILIAASAAADTYVVRPDGTGDFETIQAAIDAAWNGDVIELTDGTFVGLGNRDLHYDGKAITLRSQDGNPETCSLNCEGYGGASHRAFRFEEGEEAGSVVEGITITGCYAGYGGAVWCVGGSSPRFANCRFVGNEARYQGGAIYCSGGASPILEDCVFIENIANSQGGAVFCQESSRPSFTSCTFEQNAVTGAAGRSGGAIYLSPSCDAELADCLFRSNHAEYGGALACASASSPRVRSCVFELNTAERAGGGIVCNQATPIFESCLIQDNVAGTYGGGMRMRLDAVVTMTECVFLRNEAGFNGGAFYSDGSDVRVVSSTLAFNDAPSGGGIFYTGEGPTLENVIIAFCTSGQSLFCVDVESDPILSCCDFYGNAGGDWGQWIEDQYGINGNFSADPLFCGPAGGLIPMVSSDISPVTLQADSPCLPGNHPDDADCDLIGAHGQGCNTFPLKGIAKFERMDEAAAVELTTWGWIKMRYK